VRTLSLPLRRGPGVFRPKRVLALAGDDRLVEQIRRGNEAGFEVAFERHGPGILAFCRHLLGSHEEAEDALQHTFAAAHTNLLRDDRPIRLKPWLYTIARNRCLSTLRARRERDVTDLEPATAGLHEEVERRAELRELLRDVTDLPETQKQALLLSEAAGLSHAEVAEVLGCEARRVKALVFRARDSLIQRQAARETPCAEIREQLATLRGGSLRRNELRHHLRNCPGCSAYRERLKHQRSMLAVVLPVAPSLGLKAKVLAAAGLGGGHAGGALEAAGLAATAAAPAGSALVAKVAVVGVLAGGAAVATKPAHDPGGTRGAETPPAATPAAPAGVPRESRTGAPARPAPPPSRSRRDKTAKPERRNAPAKARWRGPAAVPGRRGLGATRRSPRARDVPRGRRAPDGATGGPVRRGPPVRSEPRNSGSAGKAPLAKGLPRGRKLGHARKGAEAAP
jgi:RNA polymerase sigma factor (sigma-70 family)